MNYERKQDWQRVLSTIDPGLAGTLGQTIAGVVARDSAIPQKYKQLILMCCAATVRYGSSVRVHGIEAMFQGASDREIVEALALASMTGGLTVMIEAIEALGDQLTAPASSPPAAGATPA